MPSRLSIYNGALGWCKATRLASTADNRSERRELDNHYDDTLAYMIKAGMWNWASRHATITGTTSDPVGVGAGYTHTFTRPTDYTRIVKISANERYNPTLDDFEEITSSTGGEYFRADVGTLYLKYVSDSTSFGANPDKWPAEWTKAFELELALRAGPRITSMKREDRNDLVKLAERAMGKAKSSDAVNQPADYFPVGRMVRSRLSGMGGINAMRKVGYPGG